MEEWKMREQTAGVENAFSTPAFSTPAFSAPPIYTIFIRHKAAHRYYTMREKIKEKKTD